MELKVGDWVEILEEGAANSTVPAGCTGMVVDLPENDEFGAYTVEFLDGLIQYYYANQVEKI